MLGMVMLLVVVLWVGPCAAVEMDSVDFDSRGALSLAGFRKGCEVLASCTCTCGFSKLRSCCTLKCSAAPYAVLIDIPAVVSGVLFDAVPCCALTCPALCTAAAGCAQDDGCKEVGIYTQL
jgi:hypothetical protein